MTEATMPVTEAAVDTPEVVDYELAFHVLPTVAEGEVADVFAAVKQLVTEHGATIVTEEAPQRFELAYPIVKRTEGKNRSFRSAYFGWVRFTIAADGIDGLLREVESRADILRALLVRLTAHEVENPFFFHEALAQKRVVNVDLAEAPAEAEAAETPAVSEDEALPAEDAAEEKTAA